MSCCFGGGGEKKADTYSVPPEPLRPAATLATAPKAVHAVAAPVADATSPPSSSTRLSPSLQPSASWQSGSPWGKTEAAAAVNRGSVEIPSAEGLTGAAASGVNEILRLNLGEVTSFTWSG